MKIEDAVKHGERLVGTLKREDAIAVHVLVELAKKVAKIRRPIRDLADALAPDGKLTQVPMFEDNKDRSDGNR